MLRKYYTADIVVDGKVVASMMLKKWIFSSPWHAWDQMTDFAARHNGKAVNFRRVT